MSAAKFCPDTFFRVALSALLIGAPTARAQRTEASVDVGAMALRYADTVNTGVAAISPHALLDWGSSIAEAAGTFSQFLTGGWSAQGQLSGSVLSAPHRGLSGELGGFAGGSSHGDGTRTGEVLANVRLHYSFATSEAFAGVGAGRTSFGDGSQRMLLGEAGLSTQFRELTATLTFSPVVLDSINYADTQLSLSWSRRNLDFDALAGFRVGDQLADLGATARGWGSLSVVAWLKPRIAAVLTGGTYPIDPTQGFPGGRFLSATIRFARGNHSPALETKSAEQTSVASLDDAPMIEQFSSDKSGSGDVSLRARAPRAQTVEVAGDFSKWEPVQLSREDGGWWKITLPLPAGKYQMNVRINGGKWIVPPGLLSMADEFGGAVGVLVIE